MIILVSIFDIQVWLLPWGNPPGDHHHISIPVVRW